MKSILLGGPCNGEFIDLMDIALVYERTLRTEAGRQTARYRRTVTLVNGIPTHRTIDEAVVFTYEAEK